MVGLYLHNDFSDTQREYPWEQSDAAGLPEKIRSYDSFVDGAGNIRRSAKVLKTAIPFFKESYAFDLFTDMIARILPNTFGQIGGAPIGCLYEKDCHKLDRQKDVIRSLFLGMNALAKQKQKRLIVVLIPAE